MRCASNQLRGIEKNLQKDVYIENSIPMIKYFLKPIQQIGGKNLDLINDSKNIEYNNVENW